MSHHLRWQSVLSEQQKMRNAVLSLTEEQIRTLPEDKAAVLLEIRKRRSAWHWDAIDYSQYTPSSLCVSSTAHQENKHKRVPISRMVRSVVGGGAWQPAA